jgi:ATP-dependent Clp protease, protease subunit
MVLPAAEPDVPAACSGDAGGMTVAAARPLSDRLLDARILMLADEVSDESAHRLITELLALSADDRDSDICLFINSPGGSVLAGLAVYDVMQLIPNDVVTVATGLAASMGQVLLCAGAAGKRFALPNAQVLMHEGSAGIGGAAADVEIQAANLVATLDRMRSIIARHTDTPIEQVVDDVGRDRWFDSAQALEYGFVDHIVESLDEVLPRRIVRRVGLASGVQGSAA